MLFAVSFALSVSNSSSWISCRRMTNSTKPLGIKVSRLASGLSMGGDLEYADEITLGRAFEGSRSYDN